MRPDAFRGDGAKLNLVNKLVKGLKAIQKEGNQPTAKQREKVNSLVARINGLQNVTVTGILPPFEIGNIDIFLERIAVLRQDLLEQVAEQYRNSKEQYGAGPEFDELANVMSLVHMREFWHHQGSGNSKWADLEERLTSEELPEDIRNIKSSLVDIRNINQGRLDLVNQTHEQLVQERQEKIAELQQQFPGFSEANLEMRATNELYVEYLKRVRNQLSRIRAAEEAGEAPEIIRSMKLEQQELQSKALFFANEAYMTAIAAEQVVLNQQIGLGIELPTAQYPASIAEQTAFIGEQIERYEDNFGRALWKTSKYVDRVLTAIETIQVQTGNQALDQNVMGRVEALKPLIGELLQKIKKNPELDDSQKDEAAINLQEKDQEAKNLATQNPSILGIDSPDWGDKLLNLQIDVNLQVQEYLMNQPNSSGSSQTSNTDVE